MTTTSPPLGKLSGLMASEATLRFGCAGICIPATIALFMRRLALYANRASRAACLDVELHIRRGGYRSDSIQKPPDLFPPDRRPTTAGQCPLSRPHLGRRNGDIWGAF